MVQTTMIRLLQLVALFAISFSSAFAQPATEAEVSKAMERLNAAILSGDAQKLSAISGAQVNYGHSDGRVQNKKEFIDALVERKSVFTKIDVTNQKIVMMGDLAVVRNHVSADIAPGGKPGHVELEIIYVFRIEGGEWKLIGRQAFKI
ncbi:nuclear transport factor 2 family protein [Polynucleobacter sp. IMCC30063]|uniref:nuclear transport factor 2 family protein n=1 Tax=unclassified Polynucleobacter TaxID=2640945 RepID=UPI001F260E84|nr:MULTISPECIES: nuclear transport factor 2 family protein [unclassified Polynucleobacter]MCE7506447.1 nuclear transport factor 2 family protein [Polynucleobacter sp. IMCC30063]MCE7527719.1 nuclear transport factor 2 family protein [Polynucleobacter sp. IMCC 30228]MCE7529537.1 nuclear transport factor 2 family protein [Polynucleobacter sp. IMCC 29146]